MTELIGHVITREERQLVVLESTYPAYRITRTRAGWFAARLTSPTADQRAAGVIGSYGRTDAVSLASALSHEHGILAQGRQG